MDNFEKGLCVILIFTVVVVIGGTSIILIEGDERDDYCEDLGYDEALSVQKEVEGEYWIKCFKFETINNSLIEIEEWVRWSP